MIEDSLVRQIDEPILYVDTAGKNAKKIAEYIQNQLKEDQVNEQLMFKEYIDPFTGGKK